MHTVAIQIDDLRHLEPTIGLEGGYPKRTFGTNAHLH